MKIERKDKIYTKIKHVKQRYAKITNGFLKIMKMVNALCDSVPSSLPCLYLACPEMRPLLAR